MTDAEYFNSINETFNSMCLLFPESCVILDDMEKHVAVRNSAGFSLNIKEGGIPAEGGSVKRAMRKRQRESTVYEKEKYGTAVVITSIPLVNDFTGNVVGAFTVAASRENEQNVVEMAENLQSFAGILSSASQQLAAATQEAAVNLQQTNNEISTVHDEIVKLNKVTEYIKFVADTINLLGLNAAIEAARAGESGRSFTVVADEIRKLAADSKVSSAKIANSLKKICVGVDNIYNGMGSLAAISEQQAVQAEEIAFKNQELSRISDEMRNLAHKL
jgi:methyl-accepting chemotaxis protein